MKADTELTVVMCCQIFDQRFTAQSSGNFLWRRRRPLACGQSLRQLKNSLLLILTICLCIFLSYLFFLNQLIYYFFFINNTNCFKSIQGSVFYKKNGFKIVKLYLVLFLGLQVPCRQNKISSVGQIYDRKCLQKYGSMKC